MIYKDSAIPSSPVCSLYSSIIYRELTINKYILYTMDRYITDSRFLKESYNSFKIIRYYKLTIYHKSINHKGIKVT